MADREWEERVRALLAEWDSIGAVGQLRYGGEYADRFAELLEQALRDDDVGL